MKLSISATAGKVVAVCGFTGLARMLSQTVRPEAEGDLWFVPGAKAGLGSNDWVAG